MLANEELESHLKADKDVDFVQVTGDGHHYQITIVSDVFLNQSKLARQKWVYAKLNDYITSGRLHAVNMQTWTKAEWEKQRG